jgi:hypothetical protein
LLNMSCSSSSFSSTATTGKRKQPSDDPIPVQEPGKAAGQGKRHCAEGEKGEDAENQEAGDDEKAKEEEAEAEETAEQEEEVVKSLLEAAEEVRMAAV